MSTNAPKGSNPLIRKIVGEMIVKPSISIEFPGNMQDSITALLVRITEANNRNEIKNILDNFYREEVFENDYFEGDKQIKEVTSIIFSALKKFEADSKVPNPNSTQVARAIQGITKKRNDELNSPLPLMPIQTKHPEQPKTSSVSEEFVEVDLGPPLAQALPTVTTIPNSKVQELHSKLADRIYELKELAKKTESYLTEHPTFGGEQLTKTLKEITLIQNGLRAAIEKLKTHQATLQTQPVTSELVQSIQKDVKKIKKDTDNAAKTISRIETKGNSEISEQLKNYERARQPRSERSLSSMFTALSNSLSNFLKFLSNLVPNFRARAVAPNYKETQHGARNEIVPPRNTASISERKPSKKGPGR